MLSFSVENEKGLLQKQLKDAKAELRRMPNGRLECHVRKVPNREDQYKWYVVKNGEREYLPKKQYELAKKLAYKRKISSKIGEYENLIIAADVLLDISAGRECPYLSESTRAIVRNNRDKKHNHTNQEIDRLAAQYSRQLNAELAAWAEADYFNWNNHPETLTVRSKTGRMVRSRIEAEIDKSLYDNGLFYRYEDPTILNGKCIYPDFTIIHPRTGERIIWEHLGRLDDEGYREDNLDKMRRYLTNGYYPNLNLILTSESPTATLELPLIEELISIFLS